MLIYVHSPAHFDTLYRRDTTHNITHTQTPRKVEMTFVEIGTFVVRRRQRHVRARKHVVDPLVSAVCPASPSTTQHSRTFTFICVLMYCSLTTECVNYLLQHNNNALAWRRLPQGTHNWNVNSYLEIKENKYTNPNGTQDIISGDQQMYTWVKSIKRLFS